MSNKIKQIASIVIVCCLLTGGLYYCAEVTKIKDSDLKYGPFFEEETEYDVLFFGTSHVLNAVFPMQLWNDYGVTSYNFGGHANSIAASYWVYKNAIEYHKPKIAVLDVLGIEEQTTEMNVSLAHISFDAFPYSQTKKMAILDIFQDPEDQKEMLYPFSIYHSIWSELDGNAYTAFLEPKEYRKEKGAESRIAVAIPQGDPLIDKDEKQTQDTVAKQYIRKFISSCRQEGIEPVLIFLPFPATDGQQSWANSVYDIAKEENVTFLNMQYEEIVDYDIDCYDPDSHLNTSGARKVTDFLGMYLKEKYALEDKRMHANFQSWNDDYEEYQQMLFSNIQEETDFKNTLMLLNNSNFKANITMNSDCKLDEVSKKLLNQIEGTIVWSQKSNIAQDSDISISIFDVKTNEMIADKEFSNSFINTKNDIGMK